MDLGNPKKNSKFLPERARSNMRIVLTPNDPESHNSGELAPVFRFAFSYYEASGHIHITKTDIIEQIFNNSMGNVVVCYEDNDREVIEDYSISSIEEL